MKAFIILLSLTLFACSSAAFSVTNTDDSTPTETLSDSGTASSDAQNTTAKIIDPDADASETSAPNDATPANDTVTSTSDSSITTDSHVADADAGGEADTAKPCVVNVPVVCDINAAGAVDNSFAYAPGCVLPMAQMCAITTPLPLACISDTEGGKSEYCTTVSMWTTNPTTHVAIEVACSVVDYIPPNTACGAVGALQETLNDAGALISVFQVCTNCTTP